MDVLPPVEHVHQIATTLHPPYNISSDSMNPVNWTVAVVSRPLSVFDLSITYSEIQVVVIVFLYISSGFSWKLLGEGPPSQWCQ